MFDFTLETKGHIRVRLDSDVAFGLLKEDDEPAIPKGSLSNIKSGDSVTLKTAKKYVRNAGMESEYINELVRWDCRIYYSIEQILSLIHI